MTGTLANITKQISRLALLETSQLRISQTCQRRTLLTPSEEIPLKTSAEVIHALSTNVIGGPQNYDPNLYHKKREELLKILPTDQSQLPARRMLDSYDSAIIPIASDPSLKDRYLVADGGVRIGRLLEDMDIFAVNLGQK